MPQNKHTYIFVFRKSLHEFHITPKKNYINNIDEFHPEEYESAT